MAHTSSHNRLTQFATENKLEKGINKASEDSSDEENKSTGSEKDQGTEQISGLIQTVSQVDQPRDSQTSTT